jgi:hypothetical protein
VLTHESNKNQTVRFGKPDGLILSGPMAIRSAAGLQRESPSSGQVVFDLRENKINDEPKGLKWQLQDLIGEKKEN